MAEGIVTIVAAVLSYLAARGIDKLIGKWAAYFTIAWEKSSNEAMRKEFSEVVDRLKESLPKKNKDWEEWRKNRGANGGKP